MSWSEFGGLNIHSTLYKWMFHNKVASLSPTYTGGQNAYKENGVWLLIGADMGGNDFHSPQWQV